MPTSLKDREEMKAHLVKCFADPEMATTLHKNFTYMLEVMGVKNADAVAFARRLAEILTDESRGVDETEAEAFRLVNETQFETSRGIITVEKAVEATLKERAQKIGEGTLAYLKENIPDLKDKGDIFDFGTGSGRPFLVLVKALQGLGWNGIAKGGDIGDYRPDDAKEEGLVEFCLIEGRSQVKINAGAVELATIMHVLHHGCTDSPDDIIKELRRILKDTGMLYVLEVIPQGSTPEEVQRDADRMRAVDIFFCRTLHDPTPGTGADIPVPGYFDTVDGWIKRLEAKGFEIVKHEDRKLVNPMFPDFQQHAFVLKIKQERERSGEDEIALA